MTRLLLLAGLVLALSACSGGSASDDAEDATSTPPMIRAGQANPMAEFPKCSDWLSRPVSIQEATNGCADGTHFYITAIKKCPDGRQLFMNERGWGYDGQPMTLNVAGAAPVDHCLD